MALQFISADGQMFGSRLIPNFTYSALLGRHKVTDSYCFFCNQCGEIWGRLEHEGAPTWRCVYRSCRTHGNGRLSMTFPAGEPTGIDADWPREALKREFLIELAEAEREASGNAF